MKGVFIKDLTYPECCERINENSVIVLCAGYSVELCTFWGKKVYDYRWRNFNTYSAVNPVTDNEQ